MTMLKKRIFIMLFIAIILLMFSSCNYASYDFVDTNYHFDKAIIKMPDESVITVDVEKWSDAEGEQLTITTKDGKRYLVSSINCILIEEEAD